MLPVYCPYNMEDIPSCFELLILPFPLIRAIRAALIFVLEFSKDGLADLGDEFADGGAAKQPVILQGSASLSSGQVSQGYCQFLSNFEGLPDW